MQKYFHTLTETRDGETVTYTYDAQGNELVQYEYDEWGNTALIDTLDDPQEIVDLANLNPLRYRGYYLDNETGYYYLQSCYYNLVIVKPEIK